MADENDLTCCPIHGTELELRDHESDDHLFFTAHCDDGDCWLFYGHEQFDSNKELIETINSRLEPYALGLLLKKDGPITDLIRDNFVARNIAVVAYDRGYFDHKSGAKYGCTLTSEGPTVMDLETEIQQLKEELNRLKRSEPVPDGDNYVSVRAAVVISEDGRKVVVDGWILENGQGEDEDMIINARSSDDDLVLAHFVTVRVPIHQRTEIIAEVETND